MSKDLLNLLAQINSKKKEVKDLVAADKVEEAQAAKDELIKLQDKFNLLADLEDESTPTPEEVENGIGAKVVDKAKKIANSFVNAIKAGFEKKPIAAEDMEVLNSMSEGSKADGGLIVPQDIRTDIKELRRSEDALETHVNVEPVKTLSGSRVIEKDAENTPFDNVDEAAEFPEDSTPQFENIDYKCKKKGGILKVTEELLQDTAENILAYLKRWIAKKSKATRNYLIINKIKEITTGLEIVVSSLDTFKDIFNVELDPAIALTSKVFTNQNGYNYLDKLKDEDGKYILQPDPTAPTKKLLFGVYPVIKLSNRTLKNLELDTGENIPFICGDLKEAITIFDRERMTVDISNVAGDLWNKDQTGMKVRERLDIQAVDEEAVVMAVVPVNNEAAVASVSNEETAAYSGEDTTGSDLEKELNAMTKAQILALAVENGYTLTVTESNTKAEIIAAYLEAANASN